MSVAGRKVALVYDAIYPYVKGGGERRFYDIARFLSADGYDVHLYGMKFWDGPSMIKKDGVTLHGLCKARPLYTKTGRRSFPQMFIFGLSCFKLFGQKIDILDCCGFPFFSIFPCRVVTWIKRKPLYSTWHEIWGKAYWHDYAGSLWILGYFLEKFAVKQPNVFIAVSEETADRLKALRPTRKIHVIHNSIDVEHILNMPPVKKTIDVIFAGRLANNKNVDVLLIAIAHIKKTGKKIACTIIGDGPERKRLEKLSRTLKIEKNITFKEFFEKHDDMLRYIKASKIFVLPSSREGFGIVVIEANAAGIPVITVDVKDNLAKKLISNDNGIVTKLHPNDLAASIIKLLENPIDPDTCVRSARKYDWQIAIVKLKEVFA